MIPLFLYTKIKVATQKDRIFESVVFVFDSCELSILFLFILNSQLLFDQNSLREFE